MPPWAFLAWKSWEASNDGTTADICVNYDDRFADSYDCLLHGDCGSSIMCRRGPLHLALVISLIFQVSTGRLFSRELLSTVWMDVNHPTFGAMAEVLQVVRVGFTASVVGACFNHKFKDAPHPFYREL